MSNTISFIAPANLPIPSVKGGAVETLINLLIDQNEISKVFKIIVFSPFDVEANEKSKVYKHTQFIYINKSCEIQFSLLMKICWKLFKPIYFSPYQKHLRKKVKNVISDIYIVEGNEKLILLLRNVISKNKLWFHIHSNIFNRADFTHNNKIAKKCDRIVSVSKFIKDQIIKNAAFPSNKIDVVRNAVSLETFSSYKDTVKNKKILDRYSIQELDIVFLYTGRIIKEKGIRELLLAFKDIQENLSVKLILAGSFGHNFGLSNIKDEFYYEIINTIKEFTSKVIFTGYIPNEQLNELLSIVDIAVLPSLLEEAGPLSIIEYRAMEIPIIVSDAGAIPEYVDSNCAIIVKRNNEFVKNLAQAMTKLVNDELLRHKMGKYNRQVNSKLSGVRYYNDFVRIIKESTI